MKKYLVLAVVSIVSLVACVKEAAEQDVLELVSAETITVPAKGGNSVIELKSKSELKAVPADSWVKAEVLDHFTVKVTVDAYTGDEVRSTSVSITNAASSNPVRVKINQNAVTFTFTPEDHEFEAEGGEYSYEYTSEAPLEVSSDADWFTTEVGEKELVIKADANEAIKARSAEVKWNIGKNKGTFNISQKGAEPTLESEFFKDGKFDDVAAPVMGGSLEYPYTTNSELEVNSDDAWIEVYTEDNVFYINVDSNDGEAREGYIYWEVKGSKTLNGSFKVSQKGNFIVSSVLAYNAAVGKDASNYLVGSLYSPSHNVADVKLFVAKTSDLDGKTDEELLATVKKKSSQTSFIEAINQYGQLFGLTACEPGDDYTMVVWAKNTDGDEALSRTSGATLCDASYITDKYTTEDVFGADKADYYGDYYIFAKRYNLKSDTYEDRQGLGIVNLSDGDSEETESGDILEIVNFKNFWNQMVGAYTTPYYEVRNEISGHYWIDGFLYWKDQEVGDFYEDGKLDTEKVKTLTSFSGDTESWYNTTGFVVGGIINDEGYIAFVDSGFAAEESMGEFQYHVLYIPDGGAMICVSDIILVPKNAKNVTPAKIAMARAKVAQVRDTAKNASGSLNKGERIMNAFKTVRNNDHKVILDILK